ncbi:MAG TPA: hypothetical protein VER36_03900, partial [Flavisolibacter sp.]|nr:hypothetical protein [Flavisolibacter sp.]
MDRIQGANGIHYRARFFGVDEIFLARTTYTRADLAATLSHEVGHYFELDHTHQYFDKGKCRQEPVDRNRTWPFFSLCFSKEVGARMCEATGDGLSDTPADPELNANSSCNFNAAGNYTTRRDNWDDAYAAPPTGSPVPSTINIMNYNGDRSCRTNFSRLQIAVMLHSIMRGKSSGNRLQWSSPLGEYDEYEMDNFSEVARPIAFNEVQERNFNMQYLGDNVWGMCDVDWVRFVAPCSGNLNISTFGMSGRLNADTRLTLFGNSFNQLAQNDDISTSNRFSNIVWNFIAGQEYFIRIDNMLPDDNRYYALKIGYNVDITGDNSFCGTSNVYNITNLPVGATVRWEALPQGVVTVNSPD